MPIPVAVVLRKCDPPGSADINTGCVAETECSTPGLVGDIFPADASSEPLLNALAMVTEGGSSRGGEESPAGVAETGKLVGAGDLL
jgi:hypothetical protein